MERQDEEPDVETMELLALMEKYPAVILILLVSPRHHKQEISLKKFKNLTLKRPGSLMG